MLPVAGSVIGLDVGWSPSRATSGICRLDWDETSVRWHLDRFRATDADRARAIGTAADRPALAAALDGPLRRGLDRIGMYRTAERMLTLGLGKHIGKPGQSSAPVGITLNDHANLNARELLATGTIAPARHARAINVAAIAEAFPTSYLGIMLTDPEATAATRADRSDRFYDTLVADGTLGHLLSHLLPGRTAPPFAAVIHRDERAALICALTALGIAADDYAAVGDDQGWIMLPPPALIAPWALDQLRVNAADPRVGDGAFYLSGATP